MLLRWSVFGIVFEDKIAYNSVYVEDRPRPLDRKSDVLTITPLNHTVYNVLRKST